MKPLLCGIDFGTSNSAVAIADPATGAVSLAPVEGAQTTIPSTIFVPAAAKSSLAEAVYGRQAIETYIARSPGRFMRSLKRVLGTSLMREGTSFGTIRLSFHNLLTGFITNLKARADQAAGSPVTHVVAGRPVHFVDGDEKADAEAQAQLEAIYTAAGFRHIRFQYEPIAAAFAHEARLDSAEYLAFVIDIGGGTSDFAIVRLSGRYVTKKNRRKDILASAGLRVGGNDFDRILSLATVMPLLGFGSTHGPKALPFPAGPFHDLSEWSRIQHMYTRGYRQKLQALLTEAHAPELVERLLTLVDHELGHALMAKVEETKIALSSATEAQLDLSLIEDHLAAHAARPVFEQRLHHPITSLNKTIAACLKKAGLKPEAINLVILTGGATHMPVIEQLSRHAFANATISESERMASVALGLAYSALHT